MSSLLLTKWYFLSRNWALSTEKTVLTGVVMPLFFHFFCHEGNCCFWAPMTAATRRTVLSLYMRVFRIARTWQAQSGVTSDTETERKYILQEARTLFRQNQQVWTTTHCSQKEKKKQLFYGSLCDWSFLLCAASQLTDQESTKKCIEECEARIEIGKSGEMPQVSSHKSWLSLILLRWGPQQQ